MVVKSPRHKPVKPDPGLFLRMAEQVQGYAVFLLDTTGKVMSWNAGAQLMKGYRADEIIGRHFSVFYPEDAVKNGWPEHELRVAAAEGRFEDENYRVRKDGSHFWADVMITALRDDAGKLVAYSKITRDFTERRAREEALASVRAEAAATYIIALAATSRAAEKLKGITAIEVKARAAKSLSPQEKRVLALVADGKTNKEIAIALGLSDKTVKNYLSNIFQKLHVAHRAHAAVIYRQSNPE
jgi:PAS domain S-box-containing protein